MGTSDLEPSWEDVVGNQGLALEGRVQFCGTGSLTCGIYTNSGCQSCVQLSPVPWGDCRKFPGLPLTLEVFSGLLSQFCDPVLGMILRLGLLPLASREEFLHLPPHWQW